MTIVLHADGSVTVADDGRGPPVDTDPKTGKNGIVKTLGTARAGGKFSEHSDAKATGAGLNGIRGRQLRVFISARTDVTVCRDGKTYAQCFSNGYPGVFEGKGLRPQAPFTRNDTQKLRGVANRKPDVHGTSVRILLDPTWPRLHPRHRRGAAARPRRRADVCRGAPGGRRRGLAGRRGCPRR